MAKSGKVCSAIKVSGIWKEIVGVWNLICEYTGDCLTGNKYRNISMEKRENQKQK